MPDELAEALANKTFCPECHRMMEVTATTLVPGEGQVPVEFKCHYCEEQWTTQAPVESNTL